MHTSQLEIFCSLATVISIVLAGWFLVRGQSTKESKGKLESLDGLRGLAAFAVVISHFFELFYPSLVTGSTTCPGSSFKWLAVTPVQLLWSGRAAVILFFVLSGFVLSHASFSSGKSMSAFSGLARRYSRLAVPVLFASITYAFLLQTGLMSPGLISSVAQHTQTDFANLYNNNLPTLLDAIKFGSVDCFLRSAGKYDAVLWTIHTEFFGSIFVYLTVMVVLRFKDRFWLYLGAALLSRQPYYLGFLFGLMLCDAQFTCPKVFSRKLAYLTLPIGIYFAGFPLWTAENLKGSSYIWLVGAESDRVILVGCVVILYAVLALPEVQWVLTQRFCKYLGKISFSVYLIHLAVLLSVTDRLFLLFLPSVGYDVSAVLSCALSLPFIVAVSHVIYLYVDQGSVTVSKLAYNATLGRILSSAKTPEKCPPRETERDTQANKKDSPQYAGVK